MRTLRSDCGRAAIPVIASVTKQSTNNERDAQDAKFESEARGNREAQGACGGNGGRLSTHMKLEIYRTVHMYIQAFDLGHCIAGIQYGLVVQLSAPPLATVDDIRTYSVNN